MKVLHVIDSGGLYGAEAVLLTLALEQQRMGMTPAILSIGTPEAGRKAIETEAEARGVPVIPWRMRKGLNLAGGYRIARLAHAQRFDVLHSHGYKGDILLGLLPRRIRRMPLVSTLHGWTEMRGWNRMAVNQWLDRRMLGRVDAVVVVNTMMLKSGRFRLDRIRGLRVIDNGIPVEAESTRAVPADSEIESFCRDGFVVGAVGRLSPEKGFDVLIDAFAILAPRFADMKLAILGEGPQRASIERRVAELGMIGRVLLPGYRSGAAAYMRCFDMLALSSRTEGLPITLLEAMAARVPVVATDVGGVTDVLDRGEYGALVEPGDAQGLARAIEQVYRAPDRGAAMAGRAQERVLEKYSSRGMAEKYLEVYRSVCTGVKT